MVIRLEVQHHLPHCGVASVVVLLLHLLRLLLLLCFGVLQTAAVRAVLGVDEQLHLELSSDRGLGDRLFFLLDGFNLSLENKQTSRHS